MNIPTPNATHEPSLRSWVSSANVGSPFPIQNLPHGVFRRQGRGEAFRGGVAIGDQIVDMDAACAAQVFSPAVMAAATAASKSELNGFLAMGRSAWSALRAELSQLLRLGSSAADRLLPCLVPQADAEFAVPTNVQGFTDFFASQDHMANAKRALAPDSPEMAQFKWLPVAYHGRASSIEVSGTFFPRPWGQFRSPGQQTPVHAPSQGLDYELELGAYIGPGNRRHEPIRNTDAEDHVFGICLLNDWSTRDVQGWESFPLGPFLAKNFLTSVSPWIVTMEALAPFRCALPRTPSDPPTMPYLAVGQYSGLDLQLEVLLATRQSGGEAMRLSTVSSRHTYWSLSQMVVHHTENGCNLRPGDLIGTGTQSGPGTAEQGCLLELTRNGKEPLTLPNGERRAMLEDGDTVILRGWAEKPGYVSIGLGECVGTVLPALSH